MRAWPLIDTTITNDDNDTIKFNCIYNKDEVNDLVSTGTNDPDYKTQNLIVFHFPEDKDSFTFLCLQNIAYILIIILF